MTPATSDERFPRIEAGSGPAVVLLHGVFGHSNMWRDQVDTLSSDFRMISLELPLFDHAYADCSVEGMARYVVDFMDHSGLDSGVFVGNSLGGHVALELATSAPDRTSGLVLTGSSGLFERSYDRIPASPTREWVWGRVCQVFHAEHRIPPGTLDEVMSTIAPRRNKFRLLKIAKSAKGTHMGDRLHLVKVPTLIAWGVQDDITPLSVAEEFHAGIPHSMMELFDECGHCPMIEYPERFTEVLGAYLRSLVPVAA